MWRDARRPTPSPRNRHLCGLHRERIASSVVEAASGVITCAIDRCRTTALHG